MKDISVDLYAEDDVPVGVIVIEEPFCTLKIHDEDDGRYEYFINLKCRDSDKDDDDNSYGLSLEKAAILGKELTEWAERAKANLNQPSDE